MPGKMDFYKRRILQGLCDGVSRMDIANEIGLNYESVNQAVRRWSLKDYKFRQFVFRKKDSVNERLQAKEAALVKALDALSEYGAHDGDCILSFWEAGQPTENGGYRTKIKGKWYQTRPVDETPKCGCGYDESMAELRKVLG